MVLVRGNAPRSIGYQPIALLLSYARMKRMRRAEVLRPNRRGRSVCVRGSARASAGSLSLKKMGEGEGFEPSTTDQPLLENRRPCRIVRARPDPVPFETLQASPHGSRLDVRRTPRGASIGSLLRIRFQCFSVERAMMLSPSEKMAESSGPAPQASRPEPASNRPPRFAALLSEN